MLENANFIFKFPGHIKTCERNPLVTARFSSQRANNANPLVTARFSSQRASNAESISMSCWCGYIISSRGLACDTSMTMWLGDNGLIQAGKLKFLYPPLQQSWKGLYWFHLVRLSICGQNRVRSVSSTILIGSISYLHILSSNFRRCVACNVCYKVLKFEILANS